MRYHRMLIYKKNGYVFPDRYDENINNVCSNGIHYYKTLKMALYKYLRCFYIQHYDNYTGIIKIYNDEGKFCSKIQYINELIEYQETGQEHQSGKKLKEIFFGSKESEDETNQ